MVIIVTDTTSAMPASELERLGVEALPLSLEMAGMSVPEDKLDADSFNLSLEHGPSEAAPKSSQPPSGVIEKLFSKAAANGDELLGIFMSSLMSGTHDAAACAAERVRSRFPGFRFRIVDSTSNSYDEAFAVIAAANAREDGCGLDGCAEAALAAVARSRFAFAPRTLEFLERGGRIGSAAALAGSLLRISPVLTVSGGTTSVLDLARTHEKALAKIESAFARDVSEHGLEDAVVHYIGTRVAAEEWRDGRLSEITGRRLPLVPVSPVIGAHVGPALGVAYLCREPVPGKLAEDGDPKIMRKVRRMLGNRR